MDNNIAVIRQENACYPDDEYSWAPDYPYPEYTGAIISKEKNIPYRMLRDALIALNLDSKHLDTAEWNPLEELIKPGDKVVIKPNLVKHENPKGSMDCLVTNVALIKAVIDYVLIALRGTGSIIVGDAPVQTCDFEALEEKYGYKKLVEYYQKQGCQIELKDFRCTVSRIDEKGQLHQMEITDKIADAVIVDLGQNSAHYAVPGEDKLRITNYSKSELLKHHKGGVQEYGIARDILEANVIINMPKPKTHRKAGVTGALKNMVGISAQKEYLPHHKRGSVFNGGDEYPVSSVNQALRSSLSEKIDNANKNGKYTRANFFKKIQFALYAAKRIVKGTAARDEISEGSWSGNDTIWRTINDLNRIVFYADSNGKMCETQQRKMLVVADMIVAGEGEGPLLPEPRQMNEILVGTNPCDIDRLIIKQFGIDENIIPTLANCNFGEKYKIKLTDAVIKSNDVDLNNKRISDIAYMQYEKVRMPSGWRTTE